MAEIKLKHRTPEARVAYHEATLSAIDARIEGLRNDLQRERMKRRIVALGLRRARQALRAPEPRG